MERIPASIVFLLLLVTALSGYFIVEAMKKASAPGTVGPTGLPGTAFITGPTGMDGVVGATGRLAIEQKPVSSVFVNFTNQFPNSLIGGNPFTKLYVIPLQFASGRVITLADSNSNVFQVNTNSAGYSVSIVYLRPTSGPLVWVGGTMTYSFVPAFSVSNVPPFSFDLVVGYSEITTPVLQNITRVATIGQVSTDDGTRQTATLSFVAAVPSGPTPLQFFSFIDTPLATQSNRPLGALLSHYYSMEIHKL